MHITYSATERGRISVKMREAGMTVTNESLKDVLWAIQAAFDQQLFDEADYLISDMSEQAEDEEVAA